MGLMKDDCLSDEDVQSKSLQTSPQRYWVYLLRCADNSYYCGMTSDLNRRFKLHCTKKARCKYTRRADKHPLHLAASWEVSGGKGAALSLEKALKGLKAPDKRALEMNPERLDEYIKTNSNKKYQIIKR